MGFAWRLDTRLGTNLSVASGRTCPSEKVSSPQRGLSITAQYRVQMERASRRFFIPLQQCTLFQ